MEFKRLLLALSLSFIFIFTWQTFIMPPVGNNNEAVDQTVLTTSSEALEVNNINPEVGGALLNLGGELIVKTDLVSLTLNNYGTSIKNLTVIEKDENEPSNFKHTGRWNKRAGVYELNEPVQLMDEQECNPCLVEDGQIVLFESGSVSSEYNKINKAHYITNKTKNNIIKTTIINDTSYVIDHVFSGLNPIKNYTLLWNGGLESTEENIKDDLAMLTVFYEDDKSYDEEYITTVNESFEYHNVGWAGTKTKYFIKGITNNGHQTAKIKKVKFLSKTLQEGDGFIYNNLECFYGLGNETIHTYSYIGPIDTQQLKNDKTAHLVQLFGFGWFIIGHLGQLILWLLTSLYTIIPNYGVICVLFAFIIRVFTGPLTKQSFISNQNLQKLQPKIKKLQEKYKTDQGKLSQATMELYKKEGVNPIGGCLPILVQMPLLIALFQVFRKTIEFRGAPFLPVWITDLSQPDVVLQFSFLENIPGISYFFGHGIALLPIIMGVIMFLSMKTTATTTEPSQKFAMYFMNAFFVLLFNTFPSGLNLYYTIYNVLNFIQQKRLKELHS